MSTLANDQTEAAPADLTELVPHRLFAISSTVPLDGRVSWAPNVPGRFQPINCYLAVEDDCALLIDTGVAAHGLSTVGALKRVLRDESELGVVLTRAEMDCVSGLGAVGAAFAIDRLMAGGAANPFDAFQEVGLTMGARQLVGLEQPDASGLVLARTTSIGLGTRRQLEILVPMFRLLATFWIYDPDSEALFTSDIFGHTDVAAHNGSPVIDRISGNDNERSISKHLLAKHWWLRKANRMRIADATEELMRKLDPSLVCPTHGCILKGKDVVHRHVSLVVDALRNESLFAA